uniref:Alpha N-terminal protein methyltransferase 1 n=1 Tax=Hirondellea gigas TaxID=1518452 RepID=A0A2P2I9H1_9CRUS
MMDGNSLITTDKFLNDDSKADIVMDVAEAVVTEENKFTDTDVAVNTDNAQSVGTPLFQKLSRSNENKNILEYNPNSMDISKYNELSEQDVNSKINYSDAASYWSEVPPTVDGMLGGFARISSADIKGSETFLKSLFNRKDKPGRARCVDCGAGIGRITKRLLQRHFGKVDMVEQSRKFTDTARENFADNPKLGEIYCMGLQDFAPAEAVYDVIWVQWVIIYLPDADLVAFFRRMGRALKPNGMLVVKDNFTSGELNDPNSIIFDEQDSSVTRPMEYIVELATKKAGLQLLRTTLQKNFPKHLFKVYMLAFRPADQCSL